MIASGSGAPRGNHCLLGFRFKRRRCEAAEMQVNHCDEFGIIGYFIKALRGLCSLVNSSPGAHKQRFR